MTCPRCGVEAEQESYRKPEPVVATEVVYRRMLGSCWTAAFGAPTPVIVDFDMLVRRIVYLRMRYLNRRGVRPKRSA